MSTRLFHEVSRHLAIRLERAIATDAIGPEPAERSDREASSSGATGPRSGESSRIPVFLSHPLDILENRDVAGGLDTKGGGVTAALYLASVQLEPRLRRPGGRLESSSGLRSEAGADTARWRTNESWARLAFRLFVLRGTLEEELGALELAFATILDEPFIRLEDLPSVRSAGLVESDEIIARWGTEELLLELEPAVDAWRELGLPEHRLALGIGAMVPVPSLRERTLARIVEREVVVDVVDGIQRAESLR